MSERSAESSGLKCGVLWASCISALLMVLGYKLCRVGEYHAWFVHLYRSAIRGRSDNRSPRQQHQAHRPQRAGRLCVRDVIFDRDGHGGNLLCVDGSALGYGGNDRCGPAGARG